MIGKLDNPTLGQALGFVLSEFQLDRAKGQPMFGVLMQQIQGAMTHPHFPNIQHVMLDLMSDNFVGPVFKGGIIGAVAGWVLDEIDMNPAVSRIGKVLKTLGSNVAIGAVAVTLLDDSTRSYSGGNPAGRPSGGHDGYPRGAGYSPLGRRDGGYFTMPTVSPSTPTLPTILPSSPKP